MTAADETRIRRLRLWLTLSCGGSLLAVALAAWALVRTAELASRPSPSEISIKGATLDQWGLKVAHGPPKGDTGAGLKVQATDSSAYVALGARRVGVTIEVPGTTNVVHVAVDGHTSSIIEIDTDTGAWTLARTLYDGKANIVKEDKIQLVPPMTP